MTKKKKSTAPEDIVAEELMRQEKRDLHIKLGFDTQEFFKTQSGQFLMQNWEQHMAITMKDGYIGKYPKGHPKAGEYMVTDFSDFSVTRGFILGIEWILEDIESRINKAKRMERERAKEEKGEQGESET